MSARVLVVDDDRALQVLLNVILSRAGFEVEFAHDGREAMEKLDRSGDFRAVLLDLILPKLSGMDILDRLGREKPSLLPRVIVLTSASSGVVEKIDPSRIHSIIRKPFDIEDLILQTVRCAET